MFQLYFYPYYLLIISLLQGLYPLSVCFNEVKFLECFYVQENEYTYECMQGYSLPFYDDLTDDDYYLIISHYIPVRKGIHRTMTS